MKHTLSVYVLLFGLLFSMSRAVPANAQVPTGHFIYTFTNSPLWDVSGTYTNKIVTNDIAILYIQENGKGQIFGERREDYNNGADYWSGTCDMSGRIFSTPTTVGASLRTKGYSSITGVSGGVHYVGTYKSRETVMVVPSTLMVMDNASVSECIKFGACTTVNEVVELPLPHGMNGDWTLATEIYETEKPNRLAGTGTLTLSNGRANYYQITGSYNAQSQLAKLRLVFGSGGIYPCTSLSLTTHGTEMTLVQLKGKLLGQKLNLP